jgi:hypothetical protein
MSRLPSGIELVAGICAQAALEIATSARAKSLVMVEESKTQVPVFYVEASPAPK